MAEAASAAPAMKILGVTVRNAQDQIQEASLVRDQPLRFVVRYRLTRIPARRRLRIVVFVNGVRNQLEVRTRAVATSSGDWKWVVKAKIPADFAVGTYRVRARLVLLRGSRVAKRVTNKGRLYEVT